jgi:hypothetical protein
MKRGRYGLHEHQMFLCPCYQEAAAHVSEVSCLTHRIKNNFLGRVSYRIVSLLSTRHAVLWSYSGSTYNTACRQSAVVQAMYADTMRRRRSCKGRKLNLFGYSSLNISLIILMIMVCKVFWKTIIGFASLSLQSSLVNLGHAVGTMLQCEFDSRWGHWNFQLT